MCGFCGGRPALDPALAPLLSKPVATAVHDVAGPFTEQLLSTSGHQIGRGDILHLIGANCSNMLRMIVPSLRKPCPRFIWPPSSAIKAYSATS